MDDSDAHELKLRADILAQMGSIQNERDQLIRKILHEKSGTVVEIMAATGLTKARIYQIRDN